MDKIEIVADFAPELSEYTLRLFSYISLHDCIVLINFCYNALGLLFQSCPVPMNSQNLPAAEGDTLPQVMCPPPPQPSCMLSFLCSDRGIENSLVI